jgi:hypothetical protein
VAHPTSNIQSSNHRPDRHSGLNLEGPKIVAPLNYFAVKARLWESAPANKELKLTGGSVKHEGAGGNSFSEANILPLAGPAA